MGARAEGITLMNQYLKYFIIPLFLLLMVTTHHAISEDKIELKTIKIKGNKELPKILYVVPWQESGKSKKRTQKLQLHNFFGDIYEPIAVKAPKTRFD